MSGLTKQQKEFIDIYLETLNPYDAAVLMGYEKDEAQKEGNSFLKNKNVMAEIRKRLQFYAQNLFVTRAYIIDKLVDIVEFSAEKEEVLNKDGSTNGRFKLKDASGALKALISLSKLVQGCEKITQNEDENVQIDNLDVDKI